MLSGIPNADGEGLHVPRAQDPLHAAAQENHDHYHDEGSYNWIQRTSTRESLDAAAEETDDDEKDHEEDDHNYYHNHNLNDDKRLQLRETR